MPEAKLNWSTANVRDGELFVDLEGDVDKHWKQSFKTTVRLLGRGEWGDVTLKKGTIRVADVVLGGEEKLRHYLKSVVEQANASHSPEDEKSSSEDAAAAGAGPDARMTAQFRSFAENEAQA